MSAQPSKSRLLTAATSPTAKMPYAPTAGDDDVRSISIHKIGPRVNGDLRELKPDHLLAMAETLNAVGLLQSITVDAQKRLLAGKHRLGASQLLAGLRDCKTIEERRALFTKITGHDYGTKFDDHLKALKCDGFEKHHPGDAIPCRIMPVDSAKNPDIALQFEVIENEKRQDFSRAEVVTIAEKLKEMGFIDRAGRPSDHEKALKPALALIIGKSERQVRRLMLPLSSAKKPNPEAGQRSLLPKLFDVMQEAVPEIHGSRNAHLKECLPHLQNAAKHLKAYLDELHN